MKNTRTGSGGSGPRSGPSARNGRGQARAGRPAAQGTGKAPGTAKGAGKGPARGTRAPERAKAAAPGKASRAGQAPASSAKAGTKAAAKAAATETLVTGVQTLTVAPDEAGMRLDRFLVARFPQLAFTHIQRIVR